MSLNARRKSGICDECGDYSTALLIKTKDEETIHQCPQCAEEEYEEED